MADKKEIKLGGQAGVAQKALGGRQAQLEAEEMKAMGGGPSGKDKEASEGSYRLTTQDKRIK